MNAKLQQIVDRINELKVDGALILSDVNRLWLTNFASTAGYVFVNKDGQATLLIDGRYFEKAKQVAENVNVVWFGNPAAKMTGAEQIAATLKDMNIHTLAMEKEYATMADVDTFASFVGKDHIVSMETVSWRAIKNEKELNALREAARIAAETANWIQTVAKEGMTEIEVANMISIHMLELGATKNSFDPIVAAGENGANPHHHPSTKVLKNGEMVTTDLGCIVDGFCSDITRSFVLGGHTDNQEILKIYDIVKKAQLAGIALCNGQHTGAEVDQVCRDIIGEAGYGQYFVHGTGHGVGIEVHEQPNTNKSNHQILPIDSVVTVEPGIYVPGVGGVRIEDTVIVKPNGAEIITGLAKK